MSIFKASTWKSIGNSIVKPFGSNGGNQPTSIADAVAKVGWGGDAKDIGSAAKDVFSAGKDITNEVWGAAKGVLNTGESLLGGVGSLLNGSTLMWIVIIGAGAYVIVNLVKK